MRKRGWSWDHLSLRARPSPSDDFGSGSLRSLLLNQGPEDQKYGVTMHYPAVRDSFLGWDFCGLIDSMPERTQHTVQCFCCHLEILHRQNKEPHVCILHWAWQIIQLVLLPIIFQGTAFCQIRLFSTPPKQRSKLCEFWYLFNHGSPL